MNEKIKLKIVSDKYYTTVYMISPFDSKYEYEWGTGLSFKDAFKQLRLKRSRKRKNIVCGNKTNIVLSVQELLEYEQLKQKLFTEVA